MALTKSDDKNVTATIYGKSIVPVLLFPLAENDCIFKNSKHSLIRDKSKCNVKVVVKVVVNVTVNTVISVDRDASLEGK